MKKIISALAIGAVVAGSAFADMTVGLNYRNGASLFKYTNKGADARTADDYGNVYDDSGYNKNGTSMEALNLIGWNSGKDSLSLKVAGDVFSLAANIQPTVTSNAVIFHALTTTITPGRYTFTAGWNGDGLMDMRVKSDADAGNEEGKVFERFKLGSAFNGSDGLCANNRVSFNTGRNFFALAGYDLRIGKGKTVNMQGSLMFDREWDSSAEKNDGNLGWGLFVTPKIGGVIDAQVFVKGILKGAAGTDKEAEFVTGAYVKPNFLPILSDSAVGGSVVIRDGNLMEYNFDLRAYAKVNKNLSLTYYGKFAKLVSDDDTGYLPCNGAVVSAVGDCTAFSSSQVLWNMIAARYKFNGTVTGVLAVSELTDLDDGFNNGRESADGTQLAIHPHVQLYAAKNATISAGISASFGGIGANKDANKDVDVIINVPVLLRVKM